MPASDWVRRLALSALLAGGPAGCIASHVTLEAGPGFQVTGARPVLDVAAHGGFGFASDMYGPDNLGVGVGLSTRLRTVGAPWTTLQWGPHLFVLRKWEVGTRGRRWTAPWLRAELLLGPVFVPEHVRFLATPVLQPGFSWCGYLRKVLNGTCLGVSLPVGYDLAAGSDQPGFNAALLLTWGGTDALVPDVPSPHRR